MKQPLPLLVPPDRPWYYQGWLLIIAFLLGWPLPYFFLLWPLWSILIIRSPWHTNFLYRVLAWAMLFSGGVLVVRALFKAEVAPEGVLVFVMPGLILTGVTQFLWSRQRRGPAATGTEPTDGSGVHTSTHEGPPHRTSKTRLRRKRLARRLARPGRHSRHPF